jgi:sporulation protein YlmC with PRC-barrel domain
MLNGKKVISSDGKVLGEVEDTAISVEDWAVTHLHVSLNKDVCDSLDFDCPTLGSIRVSLPVGTINVVGEVVVLNKSIEELKMMDEFKRQE